MHNRSKQLEALNCEIVGVSIDSHWTHNAWRNTPVDNGGIGAVNYTLVADMTTKYAKHMVSSLMVVIHTIWSGAAMRATFIIDRNGVVRHQVVNDEPLGRNMDEVVRIVEALQFFEEHGRVCPVWLEQRWRYFHSWSTK